MKTCRRKNLEAVESHDVNEESGKKMRKSLIWYQRLKVKHNVTSLLFSNQLLIRHYFVAWWNKSRCGWWKWFLDTFCSLPVLRDTPASRKLSQFLSFKTNKCHMTAKREPGISWCTWEGVLRKKEHATDEKWQGGNKCNRQIQEMLQSICCRFRPRPHEDDCKRKR